MAEKKYRSSVPGMIGSTRRYSGGAVTQVPGQIGRSPMGLLTMPRTGLMAEPRATIVFDPARPGVLGRPLGGLGIQYPTAGRRMSQNVQDLRVPQMQFSQLPPEFQTRFRERQQLGLNPGMTEQQAADYYRSFYAPTGRELPQPVRQTMPTGPDYVGQAMTGLGQSIDRAGQMLRSPGPSSILDAAVPGAAAVIGGAGMRAGAGQIPRRILNREVPAQNLPYEGSPLERDVQGINRGLAVGAQGLASGIGRTAGAIESGMSALGRAAMGAIDMGRQYMGAGSGDTLGGPATSADTAFQNRLARDPSFAPLPLPTVETMIGTIRNRPLPGGVQGPLPQTGQGLGDPRRVRAIADMYGLAGIPVPEQAQAIASAERERTFIDQLEAQRLAGGGIAAGPTPQEREQFDAAVVDRIRQNPSPINQFLGQELMGRTREGRQMGMEDLEQGYLARPMQGGMVRGSTADTMRDRERRLAAVGAPERDTGAELTQTRMAQDRAVNEELARQGTTPEQLAEIARLTGRPEIANGGMAAVSILRPGTTIRGMGGGNVPFTIARGPEESSQRREQRLASLPARRERDRLAVANRLDRMRAGRQAMMANQQAAQRQAMEMATNPIANPMLLAGSPLAQAEAMRLGQQQREFLAGAPLREAQMLGQSLQNQGLMYQNQASKYMMTPEYQAQQRQERARDTLAGMDPATISAINAMGPDGQRFIQGLYRDAAGASDGQAGTPAQPTTAVEAQGVVQQLAPSVETIIGDDPSNYNKEQLAYKLKQMQDSGMQISPQDIQTLNEYADARTMYDTQFATTGRTRASRIWEGITNPSSLMSPLSIPSGGARRR